MPTGIVRHGDPESFLRRAKPWLMRTEAENNLVLGLALRASTADEIYVATAEQDGAVVGCALRTPPHMLLLTRMPPAAVPALAVDVAACYDTLPAVHGPPAAAREFALHWSAWHDCAMRDGMEQRIYVLTRVRQPRNPPPGSLRFATSNDLGLVASWMACFGDEVRHDVGASQAQVAARIAARDLALWCDDQPRTLAGYAGRTPNGVRIGYVYTPPEWRGRGYASACVAALSERALREGAQFCCLYTDLSNPVSNAIYMRIGYEPVCDAIDIHFETTRK